MGDIIKVTGHKKISGIAVKSLPTAVMVCDVGYGGCRPDHFLVDL